MNAEQTLRQALETFNIKSSFTPGDVIEWKPGMENRLVKGPFIVVAVQDRPVYDHADGDSGTPYFREPLDIIAGYIDKGGRFLLIHLDSRRFQLTA